MPETGDAKDQFYQTYRSTHVVHRKGEVSIAQYAKNARNYAKKYREFLPRDLGSPIAELGCGDGAFVWWLNQLGYSSVTGLDISREQIEKANQLGVSNVRVGDIFKYLEEEAPALRMIVLRDVIEHFKPDQVLGILRACHKRLAPGGRLLIHVPNACSPFFGRIRYGDFTHELAFTANSLSQVFNLVGFDGHQFKSDESAVGGLRGFPRHLCWKVTEAVYKFFLTSEVGFGQKIVTQNLIASTDKPQ